jgi:hypothetical protein
LFAVIAPVGSGKINSLIKDRMNTAAPKVKNLLSDARRITIGLDIWTNKGLTSSYLGISAAFFHPPTHKPLHIFLNLFLLAHPHTGTMIANKLQECLTEWGIAPNQVLMFVTDNGSNMVKAVSDLNELNQEAVLLEQDEYSEEEGHETEESGEELQIDNEENLEVSVSDDVDVEAVEDIEVKVDFRRFPCVAHTLQLAIKSIDKHEATTKLLLKVMKVVKKVRESSVATQQLFEKAGKTLVKCNATRWNSTLFMIQRLLEVKQPLNEVLDCMKMYGLLASEWARVEELYKLLKPIQCHTDIVQCDTMVLSNVIPTLIDISCHIQDSDHPKALATPLLKSLRQRFACILDPQDPDFDGIAAAACFLDPTVALSLLSPDMESLMKSAQQFIRQIFTNTMQVGVLGSFVVNLLHVTNIIM